MTEGERRKERIAMAKEICLHRGECPWSVDRRGHEGWEIWFPKSQGEVYKRNDGTVDLFGEEWIMKEKGLI